MEKSTLKRVLALLLCLSMLVPYLNSLPLQAWAATGDDPTVTETPLAVVGQVLTFSICPTPTTA